MDLNVDLERNPNVGYYTDSSTIGFFFVNDPTDEKLFHGVVNYHCYDSSLHERHLESLPFSGLRIDGTPGAVPSMESILRSKRIKHKALLDIYYEDLAVRHGVANICNSINGMWVLYQRYQKTWLVHRATYFGEPTKIEVVYRKETHPKKNPLPKDELEFTVQVVKDIIRHIFELMMVVYGQGFYISNFSAARLVMVEGDAIPKMLGAELVPLLPSEATDRLGLQYMWWCLADFIRNSLFGEGRAIPADMLYYVELLEGGRPSLPFPECCSLLKNSVALKSTTECMTYLLCVVQNGLGIKNKLPKQFWKEVGEELDKEWFLKDDEFNPAWKRAIEYADHRCTLYLILHYKEYRAIQLGHVLSEEDRAHMQYGDTAEEFCIFVRNFLSHAQRSFHLNFHKSFIVFSFAFPGFLPYFQDLLYTKNADFARELGDERK